MSAAEEITKKRFSTIYLGGGTPSMLFGNGLEELLKSCYKMLDEGGEFTIECNPDDVTEKLAEMLKRNGVNRVSLGIQSFSDTRLKQINRRHSAEKAREAVKLLKEAGIENISIDLMFGFPGETIEEWDSDITGAISLNAKHISAYCLSVEEGTALDIMLSKGTLPPLPDEEALEQMYYTLCDRLKAAGYEHYEISNFCQPGYHSRHNSGYWEDKSYTALGAGAHGYDKENGRRYWNITDIGQYIEKVNEGLSVVAEYEDIDATTHYNDLITTAMRTSRGLSAEYVGSCCSQEHEDHFRKIAKRLITSGLVEIISNEPFTVRLSPKKLFVSDDILSEFIY